LDSWSAARSQSSGLRTRVNTLRRKNLRRS